MSRYNVRMEIHKSKVSLPHLLVWIHAIGVAGFYTVLWFRTRPKKVPPIVADTVQRGQQPFISIIVPARNEERNIQRCVTSLLEQDYPHYEVIVVDDGSTDATPRLLDELASTHPHGDLLWVLRLRDLPPGWAGKPHALHSGTREAHGEWLLFTDADTWHAPCALRASISQALVQRLDMLSLGTQQELSGFWEKVMMPMAYLGIVMQYPIDSVNDPHSPVAIANGQYILIRRSVYDTLGGYNRPGMRDTLLDDRDLAQLVKRQGFRLRLEDGRDLVHVRMYHGLRETWRGWRKNVFLGSRGGLSFALVLLLGLPMVSILPFLLPLWFLASRARGKTTPVGRILISFLELAPLLTYRLWVNKEMRVPWYYVFTHSLAGVLFEGILGQSIWRVLTRKGLDWRGRQYYNGYHR